MNIFNIIGWLILGGLAGWIASMITGRNDQMGCLTNIAAGIVGAIVGGWVFSFFGDAEATGLNWISLLIAVVGAVIVLAIVNLIFGRKKT